MDQIDLLNEVIGRVTQANLLTDKNMQLFNIRITSKNYRPRAETEIISRCEHGRLCFCP